MSNQEDKSLKDAQYRKAAPMAFLNARNTAMEMVKMEGMEIVVTKVKGKKKPVGTTSLVQRVKKYTDDLMADYMEFYTNEVSTVGGAFNSKETIEAVKACKNLKELRKVWKAMTQNERENPEILKVASELRKKYNDQA